MSKAERVGRVPGQQPRGKPHDNDSLTDHFLRNACERDIQQNLPGAQPLSGWQVTEDLRDQADRVVVGARFPHVERHRNEGLQSAGARPAGEPDPRCFQARLSR